MRAAGPDPQGREITWAERSRSGTQPLPQTRQSSATRRVPPRSDSGSREPWHRLPILFSRLTGASVLGLGGFLPSSPRPAQHRPKDRAPFIWTARYRAPVPRPSHPSRKHPHRLLREKILSREHITIAAGRYSSLASKEPAHCNSNDRKLRALSPRAQASGALSSFPVKATRWRSGQSWSSPFSTPGGRSHLSAAPAGLPAGFRTGSRPGRSAGPARHPRRPLPNLAGPQLPSPAGSSSARRASLPWHLPGPRPPPT